MDVGLRLSSVSSKKIEQPFPKRSNRGCFTIAGMAVNTESASYQALGMCILASPSKGREQGHSDPERRLSYLQSNKRIEVVHSHYIT